MLDSSDSSAPSAEPVRKQQHSPSDQSAMPGHPLLPNLKFGPFNVTTQVFHLSTSRLTFGLVNLKPLLPGHILICPVRSVPRLSQLTATETSDLFLTVRHVSRTLERVYHAESFNVAVQDGVEAGQSVPHVHVHIIPRVKRDMESRGGSDALYGLMDGEEGNLGDLFLKMHKRRKELESVDGQIGGPDADASRMPRTEDEMKAEARWLRTEIEKDGEFKEDFEVSPDMLS